MASFAAKEPGLSVQGISEPDWLAPNYTGRRNVMFGYRAAARFLLGVVAAADRLEGIVNLQLWRIIK